MSVSQVGSINVTGYSSCRSSDSAATLPAPLTKAPARPDNCEPLNGRVSPINVSASYAIQEVRNENQQPLSPMQIRLTKAFLGSRDGGLYCIFTLTCTVLICCCIGISILIAGVVLSAIKTGCSPSDLMCGQDYRVGAGLGIGGAVAILLGLCAFITRGKLHPYYQYASDPNERAAYAVLHDLYQV